VGKIASVGGNAKNRVKAKAFKYDEHKDEFSSEDYRRWIQCCIENSHLTFWNVPAKQGRDYNPGQTPFGNIVWTKAGTMPFSVKGVIYAHEYIYLFGDPERILKPIYSHWSIQQQKLSLHPAPFPPEMVAKALAHCTKEGDTVFDPFGGSGTTAAVAKAMKRHYITCDVSAQYVNWIEERLKKTKVLG
jgi:DNA modification methylase